MRRFTATASKYRNQPVVIDGQRFDSTAEAARWQVLHMLERAGKITGLNRQVAFPCRLDDELICTWVADFTYIEDGREIVEDMKGHRTPVYKLKKRLVEALYGITIRETSAADTKIKRR